MNQREKEEYLREYSVLKSQGKPFFPYAVAKDGLMGVLVVAIIMALSIVLGAELGPKANAATTTYTPRPEWYFFFLFELLRVIKPPNFVGLATIGVPTLAMILLFLLPFYDRGPERRPAAPPGRDADRHLRDLRDGLPHLSGRQRRPADGEHIPAPALVVAQGKQAVSEFYLGRSVVAQSGCEACHLIGSNGNNGPGPVLTKIGDRIPAQAIARTLVNPTQPMPSYGGPGGLPAKQFSAVVAFLSDLK